MKLASIALAGSAVLSLLTGATLQANYASQGLAKRLFEQATGDSFLGDQKCAECHADEVAQWPKSGHATFVADPKLPKDKQGCESCHGPGAFHILEEGAENIAYSKISAKDANDACLRCHGSLLKSSHWRDASHSKAGVSCVSCHQIHPKSGDGAPMGDRGVVKKALFPAAKQSEKLLKADEATLCGSCHKTAVAQFRGNSHHPVPEGRMVCSDCHRPHPTTKDVTRSTDVKDQCVTCHGEMAGPFVYEHDPVAGWSGGGCNECHKPHGSNNPKLLKAFSRGVCSQCHTDKSATHYPGRSCWSSSCHVGLHGSNTDRLFLTR